MYASEVQCVPSRIEHRERGESPGMFRAIVGVCTGTNNYVDRYSSPSRTSEPTKFQYQVPGIVHTVGR